MCSMPLLAVTVALSLLLRCSYAAPDQQGEHREDYEAYALDHWHVDCPVSREVRV